MDSLPGKVLRESHLSWMRFEAKSSGPAHVGVLFLKAAGRVLRKRLECEPPTLSFNPVFTRRPF